MAAEWIQAARFFLAVAAMVAAMAGPAWVAGRWRKWTA